MSSQKPGITGMLTILALGAAGLAYAQTSGSNAPSSTAPQPSTETRDDTPWSGMMPHAMMGRNMMMRGGQDTTMRPHMMKIMFAIADTDGDGALSFGEITEIHKRIFDSVDADNNGRVTLEEMQAFIRN